MSAPVEFRDALYRAFLETVGVPDACVRFEQAVRHLGHAALRSPFVIDRVPRFVRVLRRADAGGGLPLARILYEEGLFFECHECLEPSWRTAEGPRRLELQGLIQAAAGMHQLELGSASGCAELLEKAAEKLEQGAEPARAFAARLRSAAATSRCGRLRLQDAPALPAELV